MRIKITTLFEVWQGGDRKVIEVASEGDPKTNIAFVRFEEKHGKLVDLKAVNTIMGAFMGGRPIKSASYGPVGDDHDCHADTGEDGCSHQSHPPGPEDSHG